MCFPILAVSAIGTNIFSCPKWPNSVGIISSSNSEIAIFFADLWVTNDATIQVNRMRIMVPFSIYSSIIPALKPTKITANVAAAWDELSPNIRLRCATEYLKTFWVKKAPSHFPVRATTDRTTAM